MKKERSVKLIKRLINSQISEIELESLLEGMDDEQTVEIYEKYLRKHFDKIMDEYELKAKIRKDKTY